jgi:16S rRNA (guanine527-N7)-methyltransferase
MPHLTASDLAKELDSSDRSLTWSQTHQLASYLDLLVTWNARMNLVGPGDWPTLYRTLILDSLQLADCLETLPLPSEPVCLDIGAGAGIPGLPLRLVWPAGTYKLIEPRSKRATFLRFAIASLGLERTQVIESRAEEVPIPGNGADLLLSRAFCPWEEFLDRFGYLLGPDGLVLFFSNEPWPPGRLCPDGWRMTIEHPYQTHQGHERYFWFFSPRT